MNDKFDDKHDSMRNLILALLTFCFITACSDLIGQKQYGKITWDKEYDQNINIKSYHEYSLSMDKGSIALINITEFDVRVEMTIVNAQDIIIEKVNTANTADILVFESPMKAEYRLYINTIDGEKSDGHYTMKAHQIAWSKKGRQKQFKELLSILEKPERAGVAFAIVENEKLVFEHYNGYSNIEHGIKNNNETVFELASVSKQFTAMAIAMLAEEGKLSIDDDIRLYFPELPKYKTPVKIKHLLNHTSGIIDSEYPLALAGFENDPIDIHRVLNFLKNTPDLYFKPGTEFEYSNDGYTLLGELVHRVTGQDFKSWMEINVFDPNKMNHSVVRDSPEIIIPKRATSYIPYTGDKHFRRLSFDFHAPGGCSVRSNLNDLIKWVNYLNKGYHSNESLFERLNTVDDLENGESLEYAYGTFVSDYRGLKRYSHLGLSAGFTTSIARFPEQNLSFITLGNDREFRNYYLSSKLYEIYMSDKLSPKDEKFEGIELGEAEANEGESKYNRKNVFLADYLGNYFSSQINASYKLQVMEDSLYATSASYKPILLTPIGVDSFQSDEDFMTEIVFKRDYNGLISECNIGNESDELMINFNRIPSEIKWPTPAHWESEVFLNNMMDTLSKIDATGIFPGFSVAVFNESETFFQEGFGYANIENKKAYTPETIQLIASISKSITGMAVMKAMELGYLELDDPINSILPFEVNNPNFPDEEITIRHLMTHTSSIQDPENYKYGYVFSDVLHEKDWPAGHHPHLPYYNNNEVMELSDFLNEIISPQGKWHQAKEMFLDEKPGTEFDYSNLGFALLGYILEISSGMDFRDFTQQYIFDPLDMNSSTWRLEEVPAQNHTSYYIENYNICPNYSINTIPDGGLYSNVIDLTKFLQEAIKGYAGRGSILTQSSYKEMFRSQSDLIEIEGGLAWDLSISCCIGHGGNDFGTSTLMYFEPTTGIGRIIFANFSLENDAHGDIFYGMMGLLFSED